MLPTSFSSAGFQLSYNHTKLDITSLTSNRKQTSAVLIDLWMRSIRFWRSAIVADSASI